jgi:hypothetical protein
MDRAGFLPDGFEVPLLADRQISPSSSSLRWLKQRLANAVSS